MRVDLEGLICKRSRELARLLERDASMPPQQRRYNRHRISELRADLLELLALRRRLSQLARHGPYPTTTSARETQ